MARLFAERTIGVVVNIADVINETIAGALRKAVDLNRILLEENRELRAKLGMEQRQPVPPVQYIGGNPVIRKQRIPWTAERRARMSEAQIRRWARKKNGTNGHANGRHP